MDSLDDAKRRLAAFFAFTDETSSSIKIKETSTLTKADAIKDLVTGIVGTLCGLGGLLVGIEFFALVPGRKASAAEMFFTAEQLLIAIVGVPFGLLMTTIGISGVLSFCTRMFGSIDRYVSLNRYEKRIRLFGIDNGRLFTDCQLKIEVLDRSRSQSAPTIYRLTIKRENAPLSKRVELVYETAFLWIAQDLGAIVSHYTGWPLQQ